MKSLLLINLLFSVSLCISKLNLTDEATEKELLFVNIIWRHGIRALRIIRPDSAYSEEEWKAVGSGPGELTMKGLSQHAMLGKLLRKEYMEKMKFLSRSYSHKEVYYVATDYNRTIASAIANAIGMFSDKEANRRNHPNDPDWPDGYVPIPVHSDPNDPNAHFVPYHLCPKYADLEEIIQNSTEFQQHINGKEMQAVFKLAYQKSGRKISTEFELYSLYDELFSQSNEFDDFAERVPWATPEFIDYLEQHVKELYHYGIFKRPYFYHGLNVPYTVKRLNGGVTINSIFDRFKNKLNCYLGEGKCEQKYKELKFFAYSAHDMTIVSLFSAFGIYEKVTDENPDFASAVILELIYDKVLRKPFFQMKYRRNSTSVDFEIVTTAIPGCENLCPLEKLEEYAKVYDLGKSYAEFCEAGNRKREHLKKIEITPNDIDSILNTTSVHLNDGKLS